MAVVRAGFGIKTVAFCQRRATRLTDATANLFAKAAGPLTKEFLDRKYKRGAARELAGLYNFLNFYAGRHLQRAAGITDEQKYFCQSIQKLLKPEHIDDLKRPWSLFKRIQLDPAAEYHKLLCPGENHTYLYSIRFAVTECLHNWFSRRTGETNMLADGTAPVTIKNLKRNGSGALEYFCMEFEGREYHIMVRKASRKDAFKANVIVSAPLEDRGGRKARSSI